VVSIKVISDKLIFIVSAALATVAPLSFPKMLDKFDEISRFPGWPSEYIEATDGQGWSDISAWYWGALLNESAKGWMSYVIAEKEKSR
jgi:hypothetical protein